MYDILEITAEVLVYLMRALEPSEGEDTEKFCIS